MHMNSTMNCDLLVVGGGLHGAGIARDAAGRGLSVVLCEQEDLASQASSASLGLIHDQAPGSGPSGISALRMALAEREVLMLTAPHISKPLRLVAPETGMQSRGWKIRVGQLLQDYFSNRELLPASRPLDLLHHVTGGALRPDYRHGFAHSDGWIDSARLTVLNAMDAAEGGATVLTRTACRSVERRADAWHALLRGQDGMTISVRARSMVNATGARAAEFLREATGRAMPSTLSKITLAVVRRHLSHAYGYLLQDAEGNEVRLVPLDQNFTLLGMVRPECRGEAAANDTPENIAALCAVLNRYFTARATPADILYSRSATWLEADAANLRASERKDYQLDMETTDGAPFLSVIGGGIGSYRSLAEDAVNWIASALGSHGGAWTKDTCLPGGDLYGLTPGDRSVLEFGHYLQGLKQQYAWAPPSLIARYGSTYGSRIHKLLDGCHRAEDLGMQVLPQLFEVELRYLKQHEWARTSDDILWRRTRLGLQLAADAGHKLDSWMAGTLEPKLAVAS
jgi:glycerol-3-phosphate dehydrogenase